jgi:hypothetical protein
LRYGSDAGNFSLIVASENSGLTVAIVLRRIAPVAPGFGPVMQPPGSRFLVRVLATTAAAVLAGAQLAPSAARASCGDYVVLGDRPAAHAHAPAAAPSAPAAPRPCRGPLCSGDRQPLPPATPAPAPAPTGEQWGFPTSPPLVPDPDCTHLAPPLAVPRPLDRGTDVYHPPR